MFEGRIILAKWALDKWIDGDGSRNNVASGVWPANRNYEIDMVLFLPLVVEVILIDEVCPCHFCNAPWNIGKVLAVGSEHLIDGAKCAIIRGFN